MRYGLYFSFSASMPAEAQYIKHDMCTINNFCTPSIKSWWLLQAGAKWIVKGNEPVYSSRPNLRNMKKTIFHFWPVMCWYLHPVIKLHTCSVCIWKSGCNISHSRPAGHLGHNFFGTMLVWHTNKTSFFYF